VSADVDSARLEWEGGYRDFSTAMRDPAAADALGRQLRAVTDELRRRVGGTFTLGELAGEYAAAERWVRDVLAEQAAPGWPRTLSLVEGAAFHLYSRGAVDFTP